MRYERVEDIVKLIMLMQTQSRGVSLYDIQEEFEVSRRTAERMRDAVVRIFPQIEIVDSSDKIRRWKFKTSYNGLVAFTPEEILELETAKNKFESEGFQDKSTCLDEIIRKLKFVNKKDTSTIETDVEALLEAEGFAIRQYPRFKINKEVLEVIREAVKSFKKLEIEYQPKDKEKYTCIVHPYGVLYGEKHYLVAYSEPRKDIRLFTLSSIQNIKILNEYFEKDEKFALSDYAKNSFGIYQEKPYKIKLKFDKEVAEDVLNYHFHPTQKIKQDADGTVIVDFTAGGSMAICWHLFRWGRHVEILKPTSLRKIYEELLAEALNNLKN
jgi:predicted DNA-binding transcriptional regulator YafY